MRIKFLLLIASFFIVSFVVTSCLNNDDNTTYSSDATIRMFGLDSVYNKHYRFTIDQLKGEIYNVDSMPMGADTIINRLLIDTLNTASGIVTMKTRNGEQDSILNIKDSIDFTPYINAPERGKFLKITVWAPDMQTKKEYKISIRVHRQDPDSLNWGNPQGEAPKPLKSGFSNGTVTGKPKAVIFNEAIYVFSKTDGQVTAYSSSITDGKTWNSIGTLSGLPETEKVNLTSLLAFNGNLYIVADNMLYYSDNGTLWKKHSSLNAANLKIMTLLAAIPVKNGDKTNENAGISAIATADNGSTYQFYMADPNLSAWSSGETIPSDFPKSNISATIKISQTNIPYIMLMGNSGTFREESSETKVPIVPWSSYDGLSWTDLSTESNFCPSLTAPSIIAYNNVFYAFGNDFKQFYTSPTGITWKESNKKIYFPEALTKRAEVYYSMVVDANNFIWIICSKNATGTDDVWRARINRLGFPENKN